MRKICRNSLFNSFSASPLAPQGGTQPRSSAHSVRLSVPQLRDYRSLIPLLFAILFLATACQPSQNQEKGGIVTTTGILGDAVQNLVGDSVEVSWLMGPGVDPHLYKATQGDIEDLASAKVVVYNGLHLEGKMQDIFHKMRHKQTAVAAESVPKGRLINTTQYAGAYDPHIWFDPTLWSEAIKGISGKLQEYYPELASFIQKNEEKYLQKIAELHEENKKKLGRIPEKQRVLITAHDAFKYFGEIYNIEVKGLQGISTTAEYGIQDVSKLADFIVKNEINAIFIESSIPERSIQAVIQAARAKGHKVKLGGELYSDALGGEGSGAETYITMFAKNVETISEALR